VSRDETHQDELARLRGQIEAMSAVNEALRASRDLGAVYRVVSTQLTHAIRFDSLLIGIYSSQRDLIRFEYRWDAGVIDDQPSDVELPEAPLSARVVRERRIVRIDDLDADPIAPLLSTFGQTDKRSRSWMGAPLLSGDEVQGLVAIMSYEPNAFNDADADMLLLLASQLAVAAKNVQLFDQLRRTILQLSAPLMPVADRILVLPLIGQIDAERAARIVEQTLDAVVRRQAETVLIDITGVSTVDTFVVDQLMKIARAGQLLGTECCLVGTSASVAQVAVRLDLGLDRLRTFRDLQSALEILVRP
jgi:anti-anti-sigma regulatory factor